VIDSGIDQTHPHFAQHKNLQGTHAQWHRDFNDEVSDPAQSALRDEYGHGTHVASIRLKDSDSACEEFVKLARSLVRAGQPDRMDGSDRFFSDPPLKVFQHLGKPVSFSATALPGDRSDSAAGRGGSGLGLGDLFSGVGSAARNVLNLITFYQMKERAGVIGASALNPILRGIRRDHPALRLHLVGHSFGGRLVSATAAGTSANTLLQAESMSLLQAAFSHYGFARNWDQKNNDGVFRRVVEKKAIRHPLIITHTTSDQAVGMAYPLTS